MRIKQVIAAAVSVATTILPMRAATDADAPVFIIIGQSNADGSAMFDTALDNTLEQWYTSAGNTGKMKIWYRSTVVENQSSNAFGEAARLAVDGTVADVRPGWMDLWYKNENDKGRTAMNMVHGYGTWSTGSDINCAQGRRGMEGAFGQAFASALPQSELYILKLGVSGSFISSWANPLDDSNWIYFYEKIFKPAMLDLITRGKRPRLAGVWWMQGCADHNKSKKYYQRSLERLVNRIRNDLGFPKGKIYIGQIVKPGESTVTPSGSIMYGQGVRDAQNAVAAADSRVIIVETKNIPMQYEASADGYLHFSHAGVNAIGTDLATRVVNDGADNWAMFSTPGQWKQTCDTAEFIPSFGTPDISYSINGNVVTAHLSYPGFTEEKAFTLNSDTNSAGMEPFRVNVFGIGESNSKYYRIPALCTTNKGTLIAVADKRGSSINDLPNIISVVMKRSTDGGTTWSDAIILAQGDSTTGKTFGDPAIVCDRETGTLICVFAGDNGFFNNPASLFERQNVYYVKSTDDGLTWTEPMSFSDQIYQDGWYSVFCASGAGFQDSHGRIMFVANGRVTSAASTADVYEFLIYTDDLGKTWHVANPDGRDPQGGYGNESKVIELSDGTLLMSMRHGTQRHFITSTDRGATWGDPYEMPQLVEPTSGYGCNGDIIRYPSTDGLTRLLHSSTANNSCRRDVSVFVSYDEGKTWPVKKVLVNGPSAYSSLSVLSDGSIGCFVEDGTSDDALNAGGYDLYFIRFTLDWLTDGIDHVSQ